MNFKMLEALSLVIAPFQNVDLPKCSSLFLHRLQTVILLLQVQQVPADLFPKNIIPWSLIIQIKNQFFVIIIFFSLIGKLAITCDSSVSTIAFLEACFWRSYQYDSLTFSFLKRDTVSLKMYCLSDCDSVAIAKQSSSRNFNCSILKKVLEPKFS